jgi:hypothetical protein
MVVSFWRSRGEDQGLLAPAHCFGKVMRNPSLELSVVWQENQKYNFVMENEKLLLTAILVAAMFILVKMIEDG